MTRICAIVIAILAVGGAIAGQAIVEMMLLALVALVLAVLSLHDKAEP